MPVSSAMDQADTAAIPRSRAHTAGELPSSDAQIAEDRDELAEKILNCSVTLSDAGQEFG